MTIRNSDTGTVYIKADVWDSLTTLAVKAVISLQKPITQAQVLHALIRESLEDLKIDEVIEIVRNDID